MKLQIPFAVALASLLAFAPSPAVAAPPSNTKPPVPDFTRGDKQGEGKDWTLGPTGARGWVYGWKGRTAEARQILITAVAPGSPADGKLLPGDVILGTGGRNFDGDARILLAKAIGQAESADGGGRLKITRWRDGKTDELDLKLQVLGNYSATAPYDCEKSRRIFELGCQAIASRGLKGVSIPNSINALALLASGKPAYRQMLADYAREAAGLKLDSMATWHYGFANLFLAEYFLATGDREILPGLRRITMEAAHGQSKVGTWGHKFAMPNGNLNGYGCMNLPGLNLTISMVLAREAGIKDPDLDLAITRATSFLRWYLNKGAIPYGDHAPWPGHEDNGKCSSAAVLYDLLGDREAASFFAKMSTAGYDERERGHTGNYFNILWAMPGVSRCGPTATGAYLQETAWYYDLARGWDGSFAYQGSPVGEEEHNKYTSWDNTGTYLLAYALPLKSLFITGKKPSSVPPLNAAETAEVIAAGRGYFSDTRRNGEAYDGRDSQSLVAGLSSWSPAVRKRSARSLADTPGDWLPTLLPMLDSPDANTRYGAIEAIGFMGPRADSAEPRLRALLADKDPWVQSLACTSIASLSPDVRRSSLPDLLRMTVQNHPADPRRMTQRAASEALFARRSGIISQSLAGVDRDLLLPAIRSILANEDSRARGPVGEIYGQLSDQDLVALLPDIMHATQNLAPSNEMFADGIRLAGLDLLSRLNIEEGMALCVSVIETDRWGSGKRLAKCLESLARYGSHARHFLPELEQMRSQYMRGHRGNRPNEHVVSLNRAIAAIKEGNDTPAPVPLAAFKTRL